MLSEEGGEGGGGDVPGGEAEDFDDFAACIELGCSANWRAVCQKPLNAHIQEGNALVESVIGRKLFARPLVLLPRCFLVRDGAIYHAHREHRSGAARLQTTLVLPFSASNSISSALSYFICLMNVQAVF